MKVLSFAGGLGNQIFCYAFYLYMKNKYSNHRIFGHYNKKLMSEHFGLEIDKWFYVDLPKSTWYSNAVVAFAFLMKHIFHIDKLIESGPRECENENAIAFLAFKYTKRYLPSTRDWLKWKIEENKLSEKNKNILTQIRQTNSWFIHVRRGDFLSPRYKQMFEGCCPLKYYNDAIHHVTQHNESPVFFCFSDDLEWAKANLPQCNIKYIEGNTGADSPLDMFLMSQCNGAIIANSTFSYWGASLGKEKKVYYPKLWVNSRYGTPDIFPQKWIGL